MPTASPKKKAAKKLSSENHDPLSSSGVSSLSGIGLYSTKKITIFKNGDRFHRGVKFVINPRVVKDLEPLMNQINERIELSHGVKKLFTADGKVIKSINQLQDGKIYVAASAQFIPMRYGNTQEKVWKPPSRKHSPIISDSRIKTARTRSQEPRQRKAAKEAVPIQVRSVSVKNLSTTTTMGKDRGSVKKTNGGAVVKAPTKVPVKKAPPPKPSSKPPVVAAKPKPPQPSTQQPRPKAKPPAQVAPPPAAAKKAPPAAARRKTPKTAVSLASSVIPEPNIVNAAGAAAEILEFPEAKAVIDVVTIHKTPTPPKRSPSPKHVVEPEASSEHDEEEEEEDEEFSSDGEPEEEEEEASGSEVEEASESEVEDEEADEEESVGTDSEVNTPSSRKSSSGESGVEHDAEHNKKDAKK